MLSENFQTKLQISFRIIFLCVLLSFINVTKVIKIDNIINQKFYQNDCDFSNFETKYKVLALFFPQQSINKIKLGVNKKDSSFVNEEENIKLSESLIEHQVQLAKNHGIYGFGIIYNWLKGFKCNEEILNYFIYGKKINFHFFIIFNLDSNSEETNSIYNQQDIQIFFNSIKKYIISENYIKLTGKPVLGIIYSSSASLFINYIRNYEKVNKNNNFYIIYIFYGSQRFEILNPNNSLIKFPSQQIGLNNNLNQKYFYNFYFPNLFINENVKTRNIKNFFIINGCQPEKFYIIFRKYLNLTNSQKDTYLLFNAWNNYEENSYLEPNKEFGFAYLNYLSKAIFNIDIDNTYEIEQLNNKCQIAIQVHLFYEDLIFDIIKKTNNIPVKFDLYISIIYPDLYDNLKNQIKNFSRANNFEILIVDNKGRDVLPFLKQFKTKFKNYKYLCHIHTKKSQTSPEIGFLWRNYLYNNLLGNEKIISEILYDFENNKKLGFIFPETFYGIIKQFYIITNKTKNWMNFLGSKLFNNCKLDGSLDFPAGNMFWAKIHAIYQIFIKDFSEYYPNEDNQINDTIMHGIERIWLYLVKYNRFYYKTIFKFF